MCGQCFGQIYAEQQLIDSYRYLSVTYDHRLQKIGDPVRSPLHKLQIGTLVVEWVTIRESVLLYVFCLLRRLFIILLKGEIFILLLFHQDSNVVNEPSSQVPEKHCSSS